MTVVRGRKASKDRQRTLRVIGQKPDGPSSATRPVRGDGYAGGPPQKAGPTVDGKATARWRRKAASRKAVSGRGQRRTRKSGGWGTRASSNARRSPEG